MATISACFVAFSAVAEKLRAFKVGVSDNCCCPIIDLKRWNVGSRLIIRDVIMAGVHFSAICCEFILLLMAKWGNFDRM